MNIKLITNLCSMNKVQIKVSGPNVSFSTRANVSFYGAKVPKTQGQMCLF